MSEPTYSPRGFMHMQPIPSAYGGDIRAYESSAAMHPHIWVSITSPVNLNEPEGEMKDAVVHLRLEHAAQLRDQLTRLVDEHYQTIPGRPDSEAEGTIEYGIRYSTGNIVDYGWCDSKTDVAEFARRDKAQLMQRTGHHTYSEWEEVTEDEHAED